MGIGTCGRRHTEMWFADSRRPQVSKRGEKRRLARGGRVVPTSWQPSVHGLRDNVAAPAVRVAYAWAGCGIWPAFWVPVRVALVQIPEEYVPPYHGSNNDIKLRIE